MNSLLNERVLVRERDAEGEGAAAAAAAAGPWNMIVSNRISSNDRVQEGKPSCSVAPVGLRDFKEYT